MAKKEKKQADIIETKKHEDDDNYAAADSSNHIASQLAGGKAKNFKQSFGKLMGELKPIRGRLILIMIIAILGVALAVAMPRIMQMATDVFRKPSIGTDANGNLVANLDMTKIMWIVLLCVGMYIISTAFNVIANWVMASAGQKIVGSMRSRMKEKLNRLPLNYFDTNLSGDIISRFTNDVTAVGDGIQQSVVQIMTGIISILGTLGMMFVIEWRLALLALGGAALMMVITMLIAKGIQKYFKQQAKELGKLNGQIEETYNAQKIVKAFNMQGKEQAEFAIKNERLTNIGIRAQFLSGMIYPFIHFVENLTNVALFVVCCLLITKNIATVSTLSVFLLYISNFLQPIGQVAQLMSTIQASVSGVERVYEFLDAEEEDRTRETGELAEVKGNLELKHLKFGYSPENILMKDLNLKVKAGQIVAIVGPTGGGKTTLVNLIMRFYNPLDGEILIDGQNTSEVSKASVRSNVGMVLQDAVLFSGTIRENIAYGKKDATEEEIIEAATMAQAHHFIQTLAGGYDFVINEDGSNISVGQKQLLTIARALIAKPKILILDEATSSVDTRTEILLQKAFGVAMKNRTSFVIAHRLSTIYNADIILVVQHGDIVEQGSHEELLKKKGEYFKLYNSQFA
jgi:ATP-binding cassette subfamily B protein